MVFHSPLTNEDICRPGASALNGSQIKDINEIKKQMQSNEQTISSLKNQTAILDNENTRLQNVNMTDEQKAKKKEETEENSKLIEEMEQLSELELEEAKKQFEEELKEMKQKPQSENLKELLNLYQSFEVFNEQIKIQTQKKQKISEQLDSKFETIQKKVNEINELYSKMKTKYKEQIDTMYGKIENFERKNNELSKKYVNLEKKIKKTFVNKKIDEQSSFLMNSLTNLPESCEKAKKGYQCAKLSQCVWCLDNKKCVEGDINGPKNKENKKCIRNYLYKVEPNINYTI